MPAINIICVGKLSEDFYRAACGEYMKRLTRFTTVTVQEIAEERTESNQGETAALRVINAEGERIIRSLGDGYTVALCVEGEHISSEGLAKKLGELSDGRFAKINFVIGGSCGLSDEVKKRAALRLSMSEMTFPHQLARVMLLEQLYRAYMINGGGKYHK